MITHIWLKSQPNKKISYPDCSPDIIWRQNIVYIADKQDNILGNYILQTVARVEFRP